MRKSLFLSQCLLASSLLLTGAELSAQMVHEPASLHPERLLEISVQKPSPREEEQHLLSTLPDPPAANAAVNQTPPPAGPAQGNTLAFNFERVDIRVFTQVVGAFTGRKIAVAEDVTGTITVVSPDVSRDEAYRLFAAVLEASGFTLVREGSLDRVIRLPDNRSSQMGTIIADGKTLPEHGLVTRILRLKHVAVEDIRKTIESQLRRKDFISVLEETNHLIVTDTSETIRQVEELVRELDQPGMARTSEVIALQYADALQTARSLNAVFAESQSRAQQLLNRLPSGASASAAVPSMRAPNIVPDEHSNSLVINATQNQLQCIKELLTQIDIQAPAGRAGFNIVSLNYIRAADVAKNITALLEKYAATGADHGRTRKISVEAVESANALIINASPTDFRELHTILQKLDVKPQQVHISVLIAEVTDGDLDTLGVQITAIKTPSGDGSLGFGLGSRSGDETVSGKPGIMSTLSSGLFGQGLTFGIAHGMKNDNGELVTDYPGIFTIDAIKQKSNVKILANPSLGAQNHTPAEVSIVDNIPMTEATISGTGDDRDIIQNITRYDVGVKLALTPHVIPGGMVQMELEPSIEAVTDMGNSADYAPTISKRSAKTTMIVPDGRTLVIAGLSRNDKTNVRRKIPLLGDIPLLGWLFRWTSETEQKTNILIFVTPTVIDSAAAEDSVRSKLESRAGFSAEQSYRELGPVSDIDSVPPVRTDSAQPAN